MSHTWEQPQALSGLGGAGIGSAVFPGAVGNERGGISVEPETRRVVLGVVSGASLVTTATARARVTNPSSRYNLSMAIAFEPDAALGIAPNSNSTAWTINAIRPGGREGREARLHEVQASTAAPDLYEVNSAVREFEIVAALTVPLDAGGAAITGAWVLTAEWEPAMSLCAEDIRGVYAKCSAYRIGPQGAL